MFVKLYLNPLFITIIDKKPDRAAFTKIFEASAHHYVLIGAGLNVNTADLRELKSATVNLQSVFQKWKDADKDVTWDALKELCETYPEKLGIAKTKLDEHLSKLNTLIQVDVYY